ncbi:MAG: fumarylacetoacetate hydrolase family protein [Vicinamibacterales bacterium]
MAIIVDRVPMGTKAANAAQHIKLLMIVNDASLRVLPSRTSRRDSASCRPSLPRALGPVAVTPDELGENGGAMVSVQLPLIIAVEWREFWSSDCGAMGFSSSSS